ncbi:Protein MON2 [Mycena kentingensis (nom. inval.)]|nr:Protein MON2 [Mycena kentingensis (nom. inval.)]
MGYTSSKRSRSPSSAPAAIPIVAKPPDFGLETALSALVYRMRRSSPGAGTGPSPRTFGLLLPNRPCGEQTVEKSFDTTSVSDQPMVFAMRYTGRLGCFELREAKISRRVVNGGRDAATRMRISRRCAVERVDEGFGVGQRSPRDGLRVVGAIGGTRGLGMQGSTTELQCIHQASSLSLRGDSRHTPRPSTAPSSSNAPATSATRSCASGPRSTCLPTSLRPCNATMYLERPSGAAGPYYRRRSAIATNLPNELFVVDPARYQAITNAAGMLGLTTPRDTFFTSLTKCALPTRLVGRCDPNTLLNDIPKVHLWAQRSPPNKLGTTKTLMLQSSLFHDFLAIKVIQLDSFVEAWGVFVDQIQDTTVKAAPTAGAERKETVGAVWERMWGMGDQVGDVILRRGKALSFVPESAHKASKQESLVAFLGVVQCTLRTSRALDGVEWPLERLTRLMAILKGILSYSNSPDYYTDIDQLPPVQQSSSTPLLTLTSPPPAPPLIISDLAEYATPAFFAAFNAPQTRERARPNSA